MYKTSLGVLDGQPSTRRLNYELVQLQFNPHPAIPSNTTPYHHSHTQDHIHQKHRLNLHQGIQDQLLNHLNNRAQSRAQFLWPEDWYNEWTDRRSRMVSLKV